MNNPWTDLGRELVNRPGDVLDAEPPKRRRATKGTLNAQTAKRHTLDGPEKPNPWGLTHTQCAVLTQYTQGLTAREIGDLMGRSIKTIEVHLSSCRRAMGNVRRVQMAVLWDRFEQSRISHHADTAQPLAATES